MSDLPISDKDAPGPCEGLSETKRGGPKARRPSRPRRGTNRTARDLPRPEPKPGCECDGNALTTGRQDCPTPESLILLALGRLEPAQADAVRVHLGLAPEAAGPHAGHDAPPAGCEGCRIEYDALRLAFKEHFGPIAALLGETPE